MTPSLPLTCQRSLWMSPKHTICVFYVVKQRHLTNSVCLFLGRSLWINNPLRHMIENEKNYNHGLERDSRGELLRLM